MISSQGGGGGGRDGEFKIFPISKKREKGKRGKKVRRILKKGKRGSCCTVIKACLFCSIKEEKKEKVLNGQLNIAKGKKKERDQRGSFY